MSKNEKITEAAIDIFDGISDEQLNIRKIALARVLDEAEHALAAAERAGNEALAEKLRERVETLQELFDRAEERPPLPDEGGGTKEGGDSSKSKDDNSSKEDTDSADGKDSKEKTGDGSSGTEEDDDWETIEVKDTEAKEDSESSDSESSTSEKERYKSDISDAGKGADKAGDSSSGKDDGEGGKSKKSELNPFEKTMGNGSGGKADEPTHEEIFEAAKKILSKLSGEAKRGANEGITSLLSSRSYSESLGKPLQEAITKVLAQMTEDEFNEELAKTMDLVDQILEVDYSDDLEARITEFKRKTLSAVEKSELEKEDAIHTKASKSALRAREIDKYSVGKKLPGLDSFKASLYRAMRDQVIESEEEEETWSAINRRHEDDPTILKKGSKIEDTYEDEGIPTINVYFDQSGSWSNAEISIGERALNVLKEFHNNGDIKLQMFFISAGGVFTTAAGARPFGGAEGWADCLQHIRDSKVKNVVILSDDDLDEFEWSNRPSGDNGRTEIEGCVWWLWKNGRVSRKALKELTGKRGNYQYSFSTR